ncbi:hypothetical protein EYF80_067845 [Liparis tanakae]|uniref:Uncharacterized protein n=1 Tax=Liparis tanakae TaxID=230148 RepID=A0A4Z2E0X8_9TELE|nr:hypothetical protein EYF80_067845 [Liparis tanakae]
MLLWKKASWGRIVRGWPRPPGVCPERF